VYRGEISNAEVAGLLARVDGQSSAPNSTEAAPPLPPRRLELGMSGLAVSPAVESPNRAGVLVVAVSNESVAQKAGLITGDIIYEIDDRPTRSLADLQAAITSSAERGSATIRIFRGLKEMTLEAHF
jgi:S1-C subfamily serine protease